MPYGLRGDGRADDTDALERAIRAEKLIFLPPGR